MGYLLRDRSDGQVEIVLTRTVLVAIFPERDVAARVCAFLADDAVEPPTDAPAGFATAADDVAEAEALVDLTPPPEDSVIVTPPRPARPKPAPVRNLPAVVPERPLAPAILTGRYTTLTDEAKSAAFRRIVEGEKIASIAPDFGLTTNQLRGIWGGHKSAMQHFYADGGQVACKLCTRAFTPSLSHPETCARCSHEG
jgi:hypothetical protein